jgi:glucose-6-phosphate-specific signal transduction histidine kinase
MSAERPLPQLAPLPQRLRSAWAGQRLRIVLIANTLIAVLLTIVGVGQEHQQDLWLCLATNFVFSQSIGLSIYGLLIAFAVVETWRPLKRGLATTGLFVAGGWLGALLATALVRLLLGMDLGEPLRQVLLTCTLLAVFFGAVICLYLALYEKLERTAARLAEKEIDAQRLLRLKTLAELEALRAKVHPHFLFNALNSIASLIPLDPARAEDMVTRLAELLRYTLEASDRELVRLEDELGAVRQYLEIEKVRLGDRLSYAIHFEPELAELRLPGLLLQPLVENSVKHGIAPLARGGRVEVRCAREGEYCRLEVADTGQGFDPARANGGFGLRGVRERLDLHYRDRYGFAVAGQDGARVILHVPLAASGPVP